MTPDAAGLNWAERHRGKVINDIALGTFDYAEAFPDSDRAKELASVPGDHITIEDALQGFLKGAEKRVARSTSLVTGVRPFGACSSLCLATTHCQSLLQSMLGTGSTVTNSRRKESATF